ncbi:MAG: XRE family transcriptional regulator [Prevotella sp.]|nr:XRE family transcriptional regulator [Prevotella sp.]
MHIGLRIKEVMEQKHRSVVWLARQIECERTNIYNVFAREDVNTKLLRQLCVILEHDFFKELSKDVFAKK